MGRHDARTTMKKLLWLLLAAGFALSPAAAGADEPSPLGQEAKAILQAHCAGCHGGGKAAKGGFGFVLDRDQLVSRLLVTPGQAGQSDLFLRIRQGEMPPSSKKQRPSAAELKTLERWIDAGAPAFHRPLQAAKVLSPPEVTEAILTDLQGLDPRRRRFTRYLTLSHLAHAGRSAKDVDTTREAAGKLLNSLSWHARLSLPEAVDAGATILRIDLRAYKWSAALWERLVTAYPYRLQTATESKALAGYTGIEVAALRADWFIATASRPPFYHDLLQLPGTDRALERLLQVDVPGDMQDDNVQRAGFNDSGVSKNNRLLERHDAAYGTYWRSYDFANNTGRQNLFEHSLGPNAGATSFQPAGGEMIYHLPNGLQAYMLVDAKGKRIDKGPIEIVADPRRPDQRVETGISCMSCHARGLLFKADQLRGHVEKNAEVFGKQVVDTIRATHPRKARFQAQIEEDNVRYLKALEKFGVRDPDQEPVNLVTLRFEATLDGPTAAAELGFKIEELTAFLKQNPDQARIFGSLLVKGGTAQRSVFQENFAELARRVIALQAIQAAKAKPPREPAFEGHRATVNCVAFSPDGKRAASGSDDRTIRIWEIPSGKLLATLQGIGAEVYTLAYSSDGKFLLSGGRDRLLRLWDVEKRLQLRLFQGHTGSVLSVALSPDGKHAVSGGDDRSVRYWDVANGQEKLAFAGHTDAITNVLWARDGKRVVSASRDGTVRYWDMGQQKNIHVLEGHIGPVLTVALAPDGKTILSGGNDKTVRHWDLSGGKELHCFTGHANAVVQVQFDKGGREFFSSSSQHKNADRTFRRWNLKDRKEIGSMAAGPDHSFGCASFSPDGRYVLVGGPGGFLQLWSW
jgi:mono/diheme cytochrome c family protein